MVLLVATIIDNKEEREDLGKWEWRGPIREESYGVIAGSSIDGVMELGGAPILTEWRLASVVVVLALATADDEGRGECGYCFRYGGDGDGRQRWYFGV